jgi:hypothetical protein
VEYFLVGVVKLLKKSDMASILQNNGAYHEISSEEHVAHFEIENVRITSNLASLNLVDIHIF